eukprot:1127331-Pleurochrysis_carterae.AAC.2
MHTAEQTSGGRRQAQRHEKQEPAEWSAARASSRSRRQQQISAHASVANAQPRNTVRPMEKKKAAGSLLPSVSGGSDGRNASQSSQRPRVAPAQCLRLGAQLDDQARESDEAERQRGKEPHEEHAELRRAHFPRAEREGLRPREWGQRRRRRRRRRVAVSPRVAGVDGRGRGVGTAPRLGYVAEVRTVLVEVGGTAGGDAADAVGIARARIVARVADRGVVARGDRLGRACKKSRADKQKSNPVLEKQTNSDPHRKGKEASSAVLLRTSESPLEQDSAGLQTTGLQPTGLQPTQRTQKADPCRRA